MPQPISAKRFDQPSALELKFPPLPHTVVEVSRLLSESGDVPDTNKLVDVVNHDPVVAASVLRRINSAYYGMRRTVGDIRKAVFLLGFLEVSNVVLTAALLKLRDMLPSPGQAAIFEQLMRLSVLAAYYTQEIARFAGLAKTSTAFTAGLLHSVGRLVLLHNQPDEYEALWNQCEKGRSPTAEEERLTFGADHSRLGALAAEHWSLPSDLVLAISHYQQPDAIADEDTRTLALALALGVASAEQICLGQPALSEGNPIERIATFAHAVQLTPDLITELLQSMDANTPTLLDQLLQD